MQYDGTSVLAVFEAIASCGEVTRAKLAELTGFSQVTVGKAVDLIDACGILTQYKLERSSAGRKTGVVRLEPAAGMLLFDFAARKMRVTDILLNVRLEADCGAPEDALAMGFSAFADCCDGELMGIGCIVPDGESEKWRERLCEAFGNPPELMISAGKAAAIANAARFDVTGAAVFLRITGDEPTCGGALMMGGRLYGGIGGRAGDLSQLIPDMASLPGKLADICTLLAPELVHIASDISLDLQLPGDTLLITEPLSDCRDALDGTARMLRERWLTQKIANIG